MQVQRLLQVSLGFSSAHIVTPCQRLVLQAKASFCVQLGVAVEQRVTKLEVQVCAVQQRCNSAALLSPAPHPATQWPEASTSNERRRATMISPACAARDTRLAE